jgi:Putative lumazine-binding
MFLKENEMKIVKVNAVIMVIIAVTAITAACDKGGGLSPTATFKAYYEASKNKDVDGVKRTFSKTTLELFEKQAKEQNRTVDEMFKMGMDQKPVTGNLPEMRNEKIDGDNATLEIKDEKSGRWDTLTFVKEDGQWKIALDKFGPQKPDAPK